jgi:AraC family transcriptional regulator
MKRAGENSLGSEIVYSLTSPNFCITLLPYQGYEVSFVSDTPSIGFVFDSQQGVHTLGSDRRSDFYASANSQAYLPAGCDVFSESQNGGEYLKVSSLNDDSLLSFGPTPFSHVACREAIETANKLRMLLLSGSCKTDPTAVDQLIVDWAGGIDVSNKQNHDRHMSQCQMKRIEAYIEHHLGKSLDVISLASVFALSPGYFSREFRKAFGQSPYDYIIDRRVSHARKVLKNSKAGIADIALEHGFNSHAHMSTAFTRRLGVSPRLIR